MLEDYDPNYVERKKQLIRELNANILGCHEIVHKHDEKNVRWSKNGVDTLLGVIKRVSNLGYEDRANVDDSLNSLLLGMYNSKTLADYFGHVPREIWYGDVDEGSYELIQKLPTIPQIIKGNCLLDFYYPKRIANFDDRGIKIEGDAFYHRKNGIYVVKRNDKTFLFDGNDKFVKCINYPAGAHEEMLDWRYTIKSDMFRRKFNDAMREDGEDAIKEAMYLLTEPYNMLALTKPDSPDDYDLYKADFLMKLNGLADFNDIIKNTTERLVEAQKVVSKVKEKFDNAEWSVPGSENEVSSYAYKNNQ